MNDADLTSYFSRIGYAGPRTPSLATLRALHAMHPRAIPFESLDVLLGRPISLEPAAVQDKLVHARRGGYCYEQNLLFCDVLRALGFEVRPLLARVQWGLSPDAPVRPRSHMLLRVTCEGQLYYADVGFGGLTLTAPLRAELDVAQPTTHEPFRLVALPGDELQLRAQVHGEWRPLYRFDLQAQQRVDFEVANHFTATHPSSPFTERLMAARVAVDGRHALLNNAYAVHHRDGRTERRVIRDASELQELLEGTFAIALPHGPELDALLARLAAAPALSA
jgi:N-hydroxyarylamine O-acetyltransferase